MQDVDISNVDDIWHVGMVSVCVYMN